MKTIELKKLAEAMQLTSHQLASMEFDSFAEADKLRSRFRSEAPAAILKLLATNAELVEALKGLEEAAAELRRLSTELAQVRKQMDVQKGEWLSWEAKRSALEKDAERYRWLKEGCNDKGTRASHIAKEYFGFEWNAAIDAAMKDTP